MGNAQPHRSRMFKVSASLLLSTAYFVAAIGVWMVQSTRPTADTAATTATCAPAGQVTDGFNESKVVSGGGIPVPTGWTADAGTVLYGVDRNISRDDNGDAWLAIQGRIVRATRETLSGTATFKLSTQFGYGGSYPTIPPFDVTLLTKSGAPLTVRIHPQGILIVPNDVSSVQFTEYRDPLSGEFKKVENAQPIPNPFAPGTIELPYSPMSGEVSHENTVSRDITFTISWNGTNFTLESPFASNLGGSTKSKSYRYAQGDPTAITGIALTGQAGAAASPTMNLLAQSVTYPAGSSEPCVTGITPGSGSTGTVVAVTGNQFEVSGLKVTMQPTSGDPITIDSGIIATLGTKPTDGSAPALGADTLTFTVPAGTKDGVYQVGVTNSAGPSKQTQPFTVGATSAAAGVLACATNDPGKQVTDDFESYADGSTSFGLWGRTIGSSTTTATVKQGVGKSGNGLELADGSSATDASGAVTVSHTLKPAGVGSVSVDVKPAQTTGRSSLTLASAKGELITVSLAPDGSIQRFDDSQAAGSKFVKIGTASYKANEYQTLKIDWDGGKKTFDLTVNGTKVNEQPLPVSFAANAGDVTSLAITSADPTGASTGTVTIDTVTFPGCANAFGVSVVPTSGNAPLTVNATAFLPASGPGSNESVSASAGVITWTFGDGSQLQVGTATTVSHVYQQPGNYTLTMAANGQTAKQTITVTEVKKQDGSPSSGARTDSTANSGGGAASATANAAKLIASGGSLGVNLGLAAFLSLITTYGLLRKRQTER